MALRVAPLLLLIGAAVSAAEQSSAPRPTDDADVRAVVDRYVEARERRDGAAVAALFTADADQFTTGGEWRRGRDAVVRGGLASSEQTGGTRRITIPRRPIPRAGRRDCRRRVRDCPALTTAPPDGCGRRSS